MHWAETEKEKGVYPLPLHYLRNRCILFFICFLFEYVPYLFAFHTGGEAESQKSLAPAPSPAPQQSTNNGARQNQHNSRGNKSRLRPSTSSHNAALAPLLLPDDGQHGSSAAKKIGKFAGILVTAILSNIWEISQPAVLCTSNHKGATKQFIIESSIVTKQFITESIQECRINSTAAIKTQASRKLFVYQCRSNIPKTHNARLRDCMILVLLIDKIFDWAASDNCVAWYVSSFW